MVHIINYIVEISLAIFFLFIYQYLTQDLKVKMLSFNKARIEFCVVFCDFENDVTFS